MSRQVTPRGTSLGGTEHCTEPALIVDPYPTLWPLVRGTLIPDSMTARAPSTSLNVIPSDAIEHTALDIVSSHATLPLGV